MLRLHKIAASVIGKVEGEGGMERFYKVWNTAAASELLWELFFECVGGLNAAPAAWCYSLRFCFGWQGVVPVIRRRRSGFDQDARKMADFH